MSLTCGHSVCRGCLFRLPKQLCPLCREPLLIPLDQVRPNFGMVELLRPNDEEEAPTTRRDDDDPSNHHLISVQARTTTTDNDRPTTFRRTLETMRTTLSNFNSLAPIHYRTCMSLQTNDNDNDDVAVWQPTPTVINQM